MEQPQRPFDRLKEAEQVRDWINELKGVFRTTVSQAKLELIAEKIKAGEIDEETERKMMSVLEKRQKSFDSAEAERDQKIAADDFVQALDWYAEYLNVEGLSSEERDRKCFEKFMGIARTQNILTHKEETDIRNGHPLGLDKAGRKQKHDDIFAVMRDEPISEAEKAIYIRKFFDLPDESSKT